MIIMSWKDEIRKDIKGDYQAQQVQQLSNAIISHYENDPDFMESRKFAIKAISGKNGGPRMLVYDVNSDNYGGDEHMFKVMTRHFEALNLKVTAKGLKMIEIQSE